MLGPVLKAFSQASMTGKFPNLSKPQRSTPYPVSKHSVPQTHPSIRLGKIPNTENKTTKIYLI